MLPMAFYSYSMYFVGFLIILQVLWSDKLYVNGCYTSIISFSDSLADTGNLKQLAAMSNQDFLFLLPPYGQDFLNQSTGRSSNGRLIIDFLAESLGLPLIPPFMGSDNAVNFGQGVNYAVAGATALDSLFLEKKGIQNIITNASLGVQLSWFQRSLPTICGNASAESMGFPFIPPYVGNENSVTFGQGVNYAVAGATALDSSFLETKGIINIMTNASLGVQLSWFKQSLLTICGNISDCTDLIGRSLILMGEIGGNDYNYPLFSGKPVNEIEQLVPLVIDSIVSALNVRSYSNHNSVALNDLIEMGAKTLVVPGNFPIGCSAAFLTIYGSEKEEYDPTTGCLIGLNKFAEYHNELLQTKLNHIRVLHPNVNIIYADYYNAAMQIYGSPSKFGFTNGALKACCGSGGPFNCNLSAGCGDASATVCDQPETYVSWDGLHLTEAAYRLIHNNLFQGSYTTPQFNSLCNTSTLQVGVGLSSSM